MIVERANLKTIRKVLNRLNPGKSDPVFSFSTDCLKAGSATLLDHLALLIKSFLINGSLPIKLTAQLQYGVATLVTFLWIVFWGGGEICKVWSDDTITTKTSP